MYSSLAVTAEHTKVERLYERLDAQNIDKPMVKAKLENTESSFRTIPLPDTVSHYFQAIQSYTERVRTIGLIGDHHTGKTLLLDQLMSVEFNELSPKISKTDATVPAQRLNDNLVAEHKRGLTLTPKPTCLLLPDKDHKSMCLNIIDTPGHADFIRETSASMLLCDGVVLFVDAVTGLSEYNRLLIRKTIDLDLKMVLAITNIDELVTGLRLSTDASYAKFVHIIDSVNDEIQKVYKENGKGMWENKKRKKVSTLSPEILTTIIESDTNAEPAEVVVEDLQDRSAPALSHDFLVKSYPPGWIDPRLLNVIFLSVKCHMCFSLLSAAAWMDETINDDSIFQLASQLWGDISYSNGEFVAFGSNPNSTRSFISCILEPFYKTITTIISLEEQELVDQLKELELHIDNPEVNVEPLLAEVGSQLFSSPWAFTESIKLNIPSGTHYNTVPLRKYDEIVKDEPALSTILDSQHSSTNVIAVVSHFLKRPSGYVAVARIVNGIVKDGQQLWQLSVKGSGQPLSCTISSLEVLRATAPVKVKRIPPGNIVLIQGVTSDTAGGGLLLGFCPACDVRSSIAPSLLGESHLRVLLEPRTELSVSYLQNNLQAVQKSLQSVEVEAEDGHEKTLYFSGFLAADYGLELIREGGVVINVAHPSVRFS